ncbi:MAG: fibronectin type III domain-containing protein, partial [Thermoplasmata archaeon]
MVFLLVTAGMVIMLPLTAPKAKSQTVTHLGSTAEEDNDPSYDVDMTPGIVKWTDAEDHILNQNYVVNSSYELIIPALNYNGDPATEHEITVQGGVNITVRGGGKLTIESDGMLEPTRTAFFYSGFGMWDGIYFEPGSEGIIQDVIIQKANQCVVFSPGSTVGGPGIWLSQFEDYGQYGVRMDGAIGSTSIHTSVDFYDTNKIGTGIYVSNGRLNIRQTTISNHGPNKPNIHIRNATVSIDEILCSGGWQPGYGILIENNPVPNSTKVTNSYCRQGKADNYYVRCDGASPLFRDCTFINDGGGNLTIIANENETGVPSHPILCNPNEKKEVFDNSTINATGASTVTLQWYLDVHVADPDGNLISDSLVDVSDLSQPPTLMTDDKGWAKTFVVTELIRHSDFEENFNLFNVSAENNTMYGYAEPFINKSQDVYITVPFNPKPNNLPNVTYISTPSDVQTGPVTIDFIISDPDPGDIGDLFVRVVFWDPIDAMWKQATAHSSSDPTSGLTNGTLYHFVWDSRDPMDFQNNYSTEVYIKITAYDSYGLNGTPGVTGNFTVDNEWPVVLSGPAPDPQDTTCTITWTVDEPATATVGYGLYGDGSASDITDEVQNLTFSTLQSITLTGLSPGRKYTYIITSTDELGNTYSSTPTTFSFNTYIYIQLYAGWNMI